MKTKGLIQVYTGNGKGKTTAAVGLACRAASHGLKVCYIYFHKYPRRWEYGELKLLEKLNVVIYGFAKKHPHFYKNLPVERIRKECLSGIKFIEKIFQEKNTIFSYLMKFLFLSETNSLLKKNYCNCLIKNRKI